MTVVNWPSELPQQVLQDGFSDTPGNGVIRSDTDTGYPFIRRRFTATVDTYNIAMAMTFDQYLIFRNFVKNTPNHPTLPGIAGGSVRINFPDPVWIPGDGETEDDRPLIEVRLVTDSSPYTATPLGQSTEMRVTFKLEKTP